MTAFNKPLFSLFLFTALLITQFSHAEKSSVWEVKSANNTVYIGGTVHMLTATDHPLPQAFDKAYNKAQHIVFETDIEKSNTPEFQQKFMSAITYQDGRTLKSVLSEKTYSTLDAFLTKNGVSIAQFTMFTPTGTSLFLTIMEMQKLGMVASLGVDTTYQTRAKADKKTIGQLETLDEQISFISTMSGGKDDDMIKYTIRDLARMPEYMGKIKSAWRSGDLNKMESAALTDMKKEFPEMHKNLVSARNHNWLPHIEKMLSDDKVEFVLVGALHLAGDDGVLNLLKNKGYSVTQL